MQSKAPTVAKYLASLPSDRRAAISEVRDFLLRHLGKGYEEGMHYGMIGYCVPHSLFPAGYHCDPKQPLPFAALASQKNYMSLYLMATYPDEDEPETAWFRSAWAATGKKLDMGKCCIRWKKTEDLAFDVLAKALKRWSVKRYVANYESLLAATRAKKPAQRVAKRVAKKVTKKKAKK